MKLKHREEMQTISNNKRAVTFQCNYIIHARVYDIIDFNLNTNETSCTYFIRMKLRHEGCFSFN